MFLYKYTFARSSKVIEIDSTNHIATQVHTIKSNSYLYYHWAFFLKLVYIIHNILLL